jgi:hypothetical protein
VAGSRHLSTRKMLLKTTTGKAARGQQTMTDREREGIFLHLKNKDEGERRNRDFNK